MKRVVAVLALLLLPATVEAQYFGPPPRDLAEAQRMLGEFHRQFDQLFARARQQNATLGLLTRVERALGDEQPTVGLDKAMDVIDEFVKRIEQDRQQVYPRDLMLHVQNVRRWVDDVRLGPPVADVTPLRERIHHEVTHALQRRVLTDAAHMQQIADTHKRLGEGIAVHITSAIRAADDASPVRRTP